MEGRGALADRRSEGKRRVRGLVTTWRLIAGCAQRLREGTGCTREGRRWGRRGCFVKMKILITGGAGFIGSHIVDRLVQEGYEVVVVDNLSTGKRRNVNRAAKFYRSDIRSWWLERVFRRERPVIVCHHAAQMDVRRSVRDPVFDAETNILGTLNVLRHTIKYGVRKVLFASSGGAVYGEPERLPVSEDHPVRPA